MIILCMVIFSSNLAISETWKGLQVAPESRCSPYNRNRDYRYSQSVEQAIVNQIGKIYGPYTGTCFKSTYETDIEHIIATSEAHDSGLCARSQLERTRFANDVRNLTLASPYVNRSLKGGKDAAEWLPNRNKCWFANRSVEIRLAYGLTIDQQEAAALEQILSTCDSTEMEPLICYYTAAPIRPRNNINNAILNIYDDNGNGHITCKEARRHGIAPVPSNHPAYRYMIDGDGDGIVCE